MKKIYALLAVCLMLTACGEDFLDKTPEDKYEEENFFSSDDALKAAGIGWAKRKLLKAALAVAPSSTKATYTVKDNLVILNESGDLDTLRLSDDGKFLYGKIDNKTNFKLTRTK